MKKILLFFLFILTSTVIIISQTGKNVDELRSEVLFKQGVQFYNFGYYQQSNVIFKQALSAYSQNMLARLMLGWSYYKSGFIQNALLEWKNLQSIGYQDNLFNAMLENIYFQEGSFYKRIVSDSFTLYDEIKGKNLPNNLILWPLGMTVDTHNQLYVAGFRSSNILRINGNQPDKNLNLLGITLGYPYDICYDSGKKLFYVSDYKNNLINILNQNGVIIDKIGTDFTGNEKLLGPAGITYDSLGNFYIVDQGNNRVVKISKDKQFALAFGKMGKGSGEFSKPVDIMINEKEQILYITNYYNNRIDVFDLWGNYIESLTNPLLQEPRTMHFSEQEQLLYITCNNSVISYDFISQSFNAVDFGTYKLNEPYGVLIDKNHNMIVSESSDHKITLFTPTDKQYLNLDVKIERIDIRNYPLITCYISVKDQSGKTIYGLRNDNFSFVENNETISRVNSDYTYMVNEYPALSIVIDHSPSMSRHNDKIIETLVKIDKAFQRVYGFNYFLSSVANQVKKFSSDILALKNDIYSLPVSERKNNFDQAFYTSVSSHIREYIKGAIIVFTDGNSLQNTFSTYSQIDIINYAKNNHIPVYVFYYGTGNGRAYFIEMAHKTSGYFFEKEELIYPDKLITLFDNYQSPQYIVYYKTPFTFASDIFRKTYITVQYYSRVGRNWFGYYMGEAGLPSK